jgi:L-amino acid N-acyltransferase YncA
MLPGELVAAAAAMARIRIRRATVEDAAQIAEVINAVIAEGRYTVFDRPFSVVEEQAFIESLGERSALHVAEVSDVIAGVQSVDLFTTVAASMSHVATIGTWLRSDVRGRGIGKLLAAESFRFAIGRGYTKVVVNVLADNEPALRFYRGLGFTTIGRARQHVRLNGVFHDEVYLERLLSS